MLKPTIDDDFLVHDRECELAKYNNPSSSQHAICCCDCDSDIVPSFFGTTPFQHWLSTQNGTRFVGNRFEPFYVSSVRTLPSDSEWEATSMRLNLFPSLR